MASIIPTCSAALMESKLSARVWLEVGYACEPRRAAPGRAAAQEWRVWVRGVAGADVAAYVRKVVFRLRPENKFPYPERVFEEPPYLVRKCGFVPTEVDITVFLKHTTQPERIHLKYGPLVANPEKCKADSRCIYHDVKYPTEELRMALRPSKTASESSGSTLVVLPDSGEMQPHRPIQHKRVILLKNFVETKISKRKVKFYTKQSGNSQRKAATGETNHVVSPLIQKLWHLTQPLPIVLKDDELHHLSQMCSAQTLYEKSGKALQLPPLSDPLFHLPELPASLHHALPDDEPDYVLQ